MKKFSKNSLKKLLFGFSTFLFFAQNSFANSSRNITIFAEPNMALALTKIGHLYSQKSNVIVSINFAPSSELINNIDSGEPSDVFISAHPGWIETLRQKGLVDVYNIGYIASDKLVLVASKLNVILPPEFNDKKIMLEEALKILDQNKATLIIDNEGNSSGKFSNDFLKKFSFPDLKIFNKIDEDKSPILSILDGNNQQYALLLTSQVKNKKDLKILATKDDEYIFYQALVIAGDNMEVAREFLKFLKSEIAQNVLRESGFNTDWNK
jgi:molybdate transport system substrate-binding protein